MLECQCRGVRGGPGFIIDPYDRNGVRHTAKGCAPIPGAVVVSFAAAVAESRKLVYIAHPLSGPDHATNRANAAKWCAWAARQGVSPIADWIILSGELAETPENRALGLDCDFAAIRRCNELWLVGGRVSEGMKLEADYARSGGVTVRDLTWYGVAAPREDETGPILDVATDVWVEAVDAAPPIPHPFRDHPFGHDVCDAKVDEDGRVRTCARPRREHREVGRG